MSTPNMAPAPQTVSNATTTTLNTPGGSNANLPRAHLLSLPVELLDQIIDLVVVEPKLVHTKIDPDYASRVVFLPEPDEPLEPFLASLALPALARTCVALDKLTAPIFYRENTFGFISTTEALEWVQQAKHVKAKANVPRILIHLQKISRDQLRDERWFWEDCTLQLWPRYEVELDANLEDNCYDVCSVCRELIKTRMMEDLTKANDQAPKDHEEAPMDPAGMPSGITSDFIRWLHGIDELSQQSETMFNEKVLRLAGWLNELDVAPEDCLPAVDETWVIFTCLACGWEAYCHGLPGQASALEKYEMLGGT